MKRYLLVFLCFVALLCSCSSKKPKPTAESKTTFLSLRVGRPGAVKGIVEPSHVFLTSDAGITALVELEDLREEIEVRWDWITPDEKIYVSASRRVGPTEGMYYPKAALAHTLNVDREVASSRPGVWKVEVYIDGTLKKSEKFTIEPGLTTLLSPVSSPDPSKWALVVGIERYSHLPPVEFAASDAQVAANYFVHLLGVPAKNVILLENEKATRVGLSAKLKDYLPGNLDPGSTLYVYFAGHGMPEVSTGEPYLALFDSDATNVARTGYRVKEYLADIGSLPVQQAYVFTDACFSGMASRGTQMLVSGARPAVIRVEDVHLATGKVVAMNASTGRQLSHAYRDKRHGLFTYYLLWGLKGDADGDKDGTVALGELYRYVKENVIRVSRRTTMEQVPSVTPRIESVGDSKMMVFPGGGQ